MEEGGKQWGRAVGGGGVEGQEEDDDEAEGEGKSPGNKGKREASPSVQGCGDEKCKRG